MTLSMVLALREAAAEDLDDPFYYKDRRTEDVTTTSVTHNVASPPRIKRMGLKSLAF